MSVVGICPGAAVTTMGIERHGFGQPLLAVADEHLDIAVAALIEDCIVSPAERLGYLNCVDLCHDLGEDRCLIGRSRRLGLYAAQARLDNR